MISEIYIQVSFLKHTLLKKDSGVVEGDYNTTKLIFRFDEDVSGKRIVFQMSDPQGDVIMITELNASHEVMLAGTDNEGNVCTLFNEPGLYPFELVMYDTNAKLTSAPGWLTVNKQQVDVDNQIVEAYIPFFDDLLRKVGESLAELDALKSSLNTTFANALKDNKSGSALLIDDISPVTHDMGVKVRGKNLLPYPFAYETFDSYGITFKDNKDGTITLNGKNNGTSISNYNLFTTSDKLSFLKPNTDYYLSCNLDNIIRSLRTVKSDGTYTYYSYGNINFPPDETPDRLFIQVKTNNTTTYNNIVVKLQIEKRATPTAYTPYIPDLTAVKVSRCGKNLLDVSKFPLTPALQSDGSYILNNSWGVTEADTKVELNLPAGVYFISMDIKTPIGKNYRPKIVYVDGSTKDPYTKSTGEYDHVGFATNGKAIKEIVLTYSSGASVVQFKNFQLELGETATNYEPYRGAEYTPTADGTVNGVTSLYPNTTLMTDTEGVLIDCEYNRDINKAFAELQQAIISLGGNV